MSIDWTKPVQTRDGRKVTIYTTTAPTEYPVHGYIVRKLRAAVSANEVTK